MPDETIPAPAPEAIDEAPVVTVDDPKTQLDALMASVYSQLSARSAAKADTQTKADAAAKAQADLSAAKAAEASANQACDSTIDSTIALLNSLR